MSSTLEDRFAVRVNIHGPGGCWIWLGHIDPAGYGRLRLGGRRQPVGYAHRISYELHVGPIPDGLELDHLCRVRCCVNPDHLEPVPHRVNAARGMAPTMVLNRLNRCIRGHSLVGAYVVARTGRRMCRECQRIRRAEGEI